MVSNSGASVVISIPARLVSPMGSKVFPAERTFFQSSTACAPPVVFPYRLGWRWSDLHCRCMSISPCNNCISIMPATIPSASATKSVSLLTIFTNVSIGIMLLLGLYISGLHSTCMFWTWFIILITASQSFIIAFLTRQFIFTSKNCDCEMRETNSYKIV